MGIPSVASDQQTDPEKNRQNITPSSEVVSYKEDEGCSILTSYMKTLPKNIVSTML